MKENSIPPNQSRSRRFPSFFTSKLGLAARSANGPRALLPAILERDPLGLEATCRKRQRWLGYALPERRVFLRCAARVALKAFERGELERSGDAEAAWMRECVDRALLELVDEQLEDEIRDAGEGSAGGAYGKRGDDEAYYLALAPRLGVPARRARLACVTLNRLPDEVRRAFLVLEVEGRTLNRYVDEGFGPPGPAPGYVRHARRAISDAIERREQRARAWRALTRSRTSSSPPCHGLEW